MKHEKILKIHINFNGQKLVIRGKKSWLLSVDRQTEREGEDKSRPFCP
jgi:hypothetical protein